MAELLLLEFEGFGKQDYEKVNSILGIDPVTGRGDWPEGLLSHSAGKTDKGWIVVEVWVSRDAQATFMKSRLGPALQQAGADGPPSRAEWTSLTTHHNPGQNTAKS